MFGNLGDVFLGSHLSWRLYSSVVLFCFTFPYSFQIYVSEENLLSSLWSLFWGELFVCADRHNFAYIYTHIHVHNHKLIRNTIRQQNLNGCANPDDISFAWTQIFLSCSCRKLLLFVLILWYRSISIKREEMEAPKLSGFGMSDHWLTAFWNTEFCYRPSFLSHTQLELGLHFSSS